MGPFQALDARLYLEVNGQARPRLLDEACKVLSAVTTGGWIWILGTLLAYRSEDQEVGPHCAPILPGVMVSTWVTEYPVKA